MLDVNECLNAIKCVLGQTEKNIPLHEPYFKGNEWTYVKSCIDSGWVSSVGDYVNLFEKKITEYTALPFAVAVVNGTAALHIALLLAGVKQDDEVLIPSLTFVATGNAVAYCGAIPHFVDSSPADLGIDLIKLGEYLSENAILKNDTCINKNTGRILRAIVPVHIYGHSIDMEMLTELAKKFCLTVVEDASESLGSFFKDKHTGHFSEISVLSFNGNKIATTGGGGAILFKNKALSERAKHLTTTAKKNHSWQFFHDELGYNYRLPNINAALGCAQLEQLPQFVEKKRNLAQRYINVFSKIDYLRVLKEPENAKSNYWLNAIILNTPNKHFVQKLIEVAALKKYNLRGLWTPLDLLPMYVKHPKMDLSNTYALFDSVIALPSSVHLEANHG